LGDESEAKRCRVGGRPSGLSNELPHDRKLAEDSSSENSDFHEEIKDLERTQVSSANPSQLCDDCSKSDLVVDLQETIKRLQQENQLLRELPSEEEPPPPPPPRIVVLHQVTCECNLDGRSGLAAQLQPRKTTYMDAPYRMTVDGKWHIQGHYNAPDLNLYLQQNRDVVLVVYKKYSCKSDKARFQWQGKSQKNRPTDAVGNTSPASSNESMLLNSETLREALYWVSADLTYSNTPGTIKNINLGEEIHAPYHYFYHTRTAIKRKASRMDEEHQARVDLLMAYVESSFEASYLEARALFSQGLVTFETIPYLFEPRTFIVAEEASEMLVYEAICWLEGTVDVDKLQKQWTLRCWSWKFDGELREHLKEFSIVWPWPKREPRPIQSLSVYPLEYAKPGLEEELQSRGEKFWSCKSRTFVSYDDETMLGDPVQVSWH
jgi:hypothetical protein